MRSVVTELIVHRQPSESTSCMLYALQNLVQCQETFTTAMFVNINERLVNHNPLVPTRREGGWGDIELEALINGRTGLLDISPSMYLMRTLSIPMKEESESVPQFSSAEAMDNLGDWILSGVSFVGLIFRPKHQWHFLAAKCLGGWSFVVMDSNLDSADPQSKIFIQGRSEFETYILNTVSKNDCAVSASALFLRSAVEENNQGNPEGLEVEMVEGEAAGVEVVVR